MQFSLLSTQESDRSSCSAGHCASGKMPWLFVTSHTSFWEVGLCVTQPCFSLILHAVSWALHTRCGNNNKAVFTCITSELQHWSHYLIATPRMFTSWCVIMLLPSSSVYLAFGLSVDMCLSILRHRASVSPQLKQTLFFRRYLSQLSTSCSRPGSWIKLLWT